MSWSSWMVMRSAPGCGVPARQPHPRAGPLVRHAEAPVGVRRPGKGSGQDKVAEPDVRNADEEGYHRDDGSIPRELPEPDRISIALRDPDHDNVRAGANSRGVSAEVRAQGEGPPEHCRVRSRWGVRHEI